MCPTDAIVVRARMIAKRIPARRAQKDQTENEGGEPFGQGTVSEE
jgi:hypothetical protein